MIGILLTFLFVGAGVLFYLYDTGVFNRGICSKGGFHDIPPMDGVIRADNIYFCRKCLQPFIGVYKEPYCVDLYKAQNICHKNLPNSNASSGHVWHGGVDGECANCHRSVLS